MRVGRFHSLRSQTRVTSILIAVGATIAATGIAPAHADLGDVAPPPAAAAVPTPDVRGIFLVDATGRSVSLAEELAEPGPVFVNFVFTSCPTVCPVMSATFARLEDRLESDGIGARLLSVSIDPLHDTPERLRDYGDRHGAGAHWRLFTGTPEASEAAQKAFGVWRGDKMNHVVATFVRPAAGESWLRVDGFASPGDLAAKIGRLPAKRSAGAKPREDGGTVRRPSGPGENERGG